MKWNKKKFLTINLNIMETQNITLFIESINNKIVQLEKRNEILEIRRYKRILSICWDNITKK
jgi:hypothetical protein